MSKTADIDAEHRPPSVKGPDRPLVGIALKLASTLAFSLMVALLKLIEEQDVPLGQALFARSFFGIPPLLLWLAWRPGGIRDALYTRDLKGHFFRGILGATGMALWFSALARLPLPDAQAIQFAGPFIAVILAVFLLGEKVRIYRWSAVAVGFTGVLIVLSTHLRGLDTLFDDAGFIGALFALGSATTGALAMIQVRRLTRTEGTGSIVFYFSFFTTLFSLFTIPFGWVMPTPQQAVLLVVMGLLGGVGQVLLTHSYRYAEASTIAPFDYAAMLWVILLGVFVFGEVPGLAVIVGSVIIIGSGVFVLYREHRAGALKSRVRQANTPS